MRVLDLFSGIGGFALGLQLAGGFTTAAFCELDPWCRRVLGKNFPGVPIFEDVKKLRGDEVGAVDLICGGYPCQPFSVAGERKGTEDDRHLWPEFMRLVAELRPRWVIGENVAGHISMGLDAVLSDLENAGYTCRAFVIPAIAVDARHRRDRVWVVANAGGRRCGGEKIRQVQQPRRGKAERTSETVANTCCSGRQKQHLAAKPDQPGYSAGGFNPVWREWPAEPGVGRVADGVPYRVDRIKGLGNGVVPWEVMMIGGAIMAAEAERRAAA